jgi:Astacin (Peptidase family M12A)
MQNHIDRDRYVKIRFENIDKSMAYNFDKVSSVDYGNFNTAYDYFSVMHYNRVAFSINGKDTMVPTNPDYINIIGQKKISLGDIARINNMYKC